MKPEKILLITLSDRQKTEDAKTSIQNEFPGSQISTLEIQSVDKPGSFLKLINRAGIFDATVFVIKRSYFSNPVFFFGFFLGIIGRVHHPLFLIKNGRFLSRWEMITEFFLLSFAPFFVLFGLPGYFWQQIIKKFLMTPEDRDDIFVGFGQGKKLGGIIYWLIFPPKVRKHGLFGLAHENYWGMPLGIHSWPVAIFFLEKLGYRRFFLFSTGLISAGMIWMAAGSGNSWFFLLIPLLLLSNYYLFNLYVGTWELLAWGWGLLAFCAFHSQIPELAGIFFALCLLSHPGVCSLSGVIIATFAVLSSGLLPAFPLFLRMGIVTAILTLWWLVPYFRTSRFLGRKNIINKHWQRIRPWSISSAYQFILTSLFALVVSFASGKPLISFLLLLPPILVYYNIKISWVYSQYTTMNFFLIAGFIFLIQFPTAIGWILYIFILFTSVKLIWGLRMDPYKGYDLTPLTIGKSRREVIEAYQKVDGRVGFEMELSMEDGSWKYSPGIGFMLAGTDHDLVNVAYSQIGDFRILEKYCQFFNSKTSAAVFKKASVDCGVTYMTAITDEFCQYLSGLGASKISEVPEVYLTDSPEDLPVKITIFKLPWEAEIISEPVNLTVDRNSISFPASAGLTYRIKYSAFSGWRAFQNGKRIPIVDAEPGIKVSAETDGLIELKYKLRHYWSR